MQYNGYKARCAILWLAQQMDVPRGFVMKDMVLLEIAAAAPQNMEQLQDVRGLPEDLALAPFATELLAIISKIDAIPVEDLPVLIERSHTPSHIKPVVELLRLLLKQQSMAFHVAEKLIADESDLFLIAKEEGTQKPDIPSMHGWKYEIFGRYAMELKNGNMAFTLRDGKIAIISLNS